MNTKGMLGLDVVMDVEGGLGGRERGREGGRGKRGGREGGIGKVRVGR
jgi:hypothetical protein